MADATPTKSKGGRPSSYSEERVAPLLARLASGEALTKICKDDGMPDVVTIYKWMLQHPEFAQAYARAREDQAETLADEIVAIADEECEPEFAQQQKLRVDARKWVASKLKPKRYGDRLTSEHSGPGGGPIPFAEVKRTIVEPPGGGEDGK